MPIATAILRPAKDEPLAKRRRWKIVKAALAFLFFFLLLSAGFQGRQHARLQANLEDLSLLRNQLQQKLEEEQRPAEQLQIPALVGALRTRLEQFDSDHRPGQLSEVERLELRLSKATFFNAQRHFAEALTTLTVEDEKAQRAGLTQTERLLRILQVRGDSFYGLHEWRDALDRYQQVLTLKPDRLATMARAADCQYALGKTNEALTAYDELAKSHNHQGGVLLVQGKTDAALGHYAKAIEILTRLVEQQGRSELARDLAKSHNNRGDALLVQGKPDAAIQYYAKAIEIQTRLIGPQGPSELATSHGNLGVALLSQRKLDAVIGHFEKAIEIQTRLFAQTPRSELASDLALTHNNRGAVRRAQGKLDAALADFDTAIKTLAARLEPQGGSESARAQTNRPAARHAQVKLDVIIEHSEKDVDVRTRPRLAEQAGRRELEVILAMVLKNRGHAYLVQRKPDGASADFKKAVEIFARLVEQEGQTDLAPQYVLSLSPLAWIYATHPEPSLRNGGKAREYALKACALSGWMAFVPLQTLAAACAETGNFAEAVQWQEKALELAPPEDKVEVRSRLEIFKSGNPYRMPLPKAG